MESTELRKRKREEYEMQLFGFHSRAVFATMQDIISKRICSTTAKLCRSIEEIYKLDNENIKILKKNKKQLERVYCKEALLHLKHIENIANKFVAVPSNILLEEDKCQRRQYTDTEFKNMKDELEDLQQRAKRATILNATLKEESEILKNYPISEDSVNEMQKTVETGLQCVDISNQVYKLMDDYKLFSTSLYGVITIAEKSKYNTIDNLKCKDIDLNSL